MIHRRDFLRRSVLSGAAFASLPMIGAENSTTTPSTSETLVKTLFDSLTEAQRGPLCFGFDDPLRSKVSNNWHITDQRIGNFLTADQNAMVREIFLKAHSDEYAATVLKQVEHDSGKAGFGDSSIAVFGQPGSGKFEFVLTGRHCTRRIDGDSVAGKAFGGPIFYGHAAGGFNESADHQGNAYWYQAQAANRVFQMLDGKQRESALQEKEAPDNAATIQLRRQTGDLPGLAVSEMTADQKDAVRGVLKDLLMPFREVDRVESMKLIEKGGFDNLHLVFYRQGDLGNDGVWDNWRLEGPHLVWYFRGAPHVHTWVHISDPETPREPRA
jgi:hypothetical protein